MRYSAWYRTFLVILSLGICPVISVEVGLKRGLAKATTIKAELGARRQDHQVGGAEATSGATPHFVSSRPGVDLISLPVAVMKIDQMDPMMFCRH